MAGVRIGFEATYTSGLGRNQYRYTIVVDQSGVVSFRDITSPNGLVMDSMTRVPQTVVNDINTSMAQVEDLLSMTSTINGTLVFSSEAEKSVTFATPLTGTSYRVLLSSSVLSPLRITNKLTTGFTVQAGATITGNVGYDVFV